MEERQRVGEQRGKEGSKGIVVFLIEKDIHSTGVKRKLEKRRTGRIKEQQERNRPRI